MYMYVCAGTVYLPHEPLFFQSLWNPFIFRCADGVMIDGNHRGLSKWIYKWVMILISLYICCYISISYPVCNVLQITC